MAIGGQTSTLADQRYIAALEKRLRELEDRIVKAEQKLRELGAK